MIFTTIDNESPAHDGVELEEMPWLREWQDRLENGAGQEKFTAASVMNMRIWKAFHWQPGPAEKVLGWIATGRW